MYIIKRMLLRIIDVVAVPFVVIGGTVLKFLRVKQIDRFPFSRRLLIRMGVFPLQDHYYDPLFNPKHLRHSLREDRALPGIDLNVDVQIELLNSFDYNKELLEFPIDPIGTDNVYYYNNKSYASGDGEILYSMVRHFKPNRIIEIGAGYSTLMIENAIKKIEKKTILMFVNIFVLSHMKCCGLSLCRLK